MYKIFHRRGTDVGIIGTTGITQKDPTMPQKRGKLTRGYVPNLRSTYVSLTQNSDTAAQLVFLFHFADE